MGAIGGIQINFSEARNDETSKKLFNRGVDKLTKIICIIISYVDDDGVIRYTVKESKMGELVKNLLSLFNFLLSLTQCVGHTLK